MREKAGVVGRNVVKLVNKNGRLGNFYFRGGRLLRVTRVTRVASDAWV